MAIRYRGDAFRFRVPMTVLALCAAPALAWAQGVAPAAGTASRAAAEAAAPRTALEFPYAMAGRMKVASNPEALVLIRGDSVHLASPGAVLDSTYRVESLTRDALVVTHMPSGQRRSIAIADIKPAPGATSAGQTAAPTDKLPVREVWVRPSADGSPPYDVLNPPAGVVFRADPSDFQVPATAPAAPPEPAAAGAPREIQVQAGPDGSVPPIIGLPPDVVVKVAPVPPGTKP